MKEARFPEGKSVDVPKYLREHGNPEAADEWEKMNEEYGDLLKKAGDVFTPPPRIKVPDLVKPGDTVNYFWRAQPYPAPQEIRTGIYIGPKEGHKVRCSNCQDNQVYLIKDAEGKEWGVPGDDILDALQTSLSKTASISTKTRAGTRVVVNGNPASKMLYGTTRLPPDGTMGTVTLMALPGGKRTYLPGPGGGLIYVDFDNGVTMGVAPQDLDLATTRKAGQELLPKSISSKIPKLYSQEKVTDPIVWVKFFNPYGQGTWLITEFDGRDTMFGLADLGFPELGNVSLSELASLTKFGAPMIERDIHFRPMPLSEAIKKEHINYRMAASNKQASRPLYEIAREIRKDWGSKVNYAAKPYLEAMGDLNKISDMYGQDPGTSIVAYFLSNASSWKGEKAKEIKTELKAMLKSGGRSAMSELTKMARTEDESVQEMEQMLADYEEEGTNTDGDDRHPELDEGSLIPGIQERLASDAKLKDFAKKATGEGTDPEWMESLKKDMKTLASRSGGLVQLLEVRAFDQYQGPYARIRVKNLGVFKVWTIEEGFYIPDFPIVNTSSSERDGFKASDIYDLREGIKKAVKESGTKKASVETHMAALEALAGNPADDKFSRFEEGVSADPTKNMSPEDKAKWNKQKEEHKDEFKKEAARWMKQHEKAIDRWLASHPNYRGPDDWDSMPSDLTSALERINDYESLWSDAQRYFGDKLHKQKMSEKWASNVVFADDEHGETFAKEEHKDEFKKEAKEPEKTLGKGPYGYIAMYKGRRVDVYAKTKAEAIDLAAAYFKAKKSYDVDVWLAEKNGKPVVHTPTFASTEKQASQVVFAEDEYGEVFAFEMSPMQALLHMASQKTAFNKTDEDFVEWAINQPPMSKSETIVALKKAGVGDILPPKEKPVGPRFQVGDEVLISASKHKNDKTVEVYIEHDKKVGTVINIDSVGATVQFKSGTPVNFPDAQARQGVGIYKWIKPFDMQGSKKLEVVYEAGRPSANSDRMVVVQQYLNRGKSENRKVPYLTGHAFTPRFNKQGGVYFTMLPQQRLHVDPRGNTTEAGYEGTSINPDIGKLYYLGVFGKRPPRWEAELATIRQNSTVTASEDKSDDKLSRFEEGKPADPTKNMSPEDAKKWHAQKEEHKDEFKTAFTSYKGDPFWMKAKYPGKADDGTPFKKGADILYWPRTKTIMVGKKAEREWADFKSHAEDEDFYMSQYHGASSEKEAVALPMQQDLSRVAANSQIDKAKFMLEDLFGEHHGKVPQDEIEAFMNENKYKRTALIVALKQLVHDHYIKLEGSLYRWVGGKLSDALETNWGMHLAAQSPTGLYGYTRKVQADCETCARKLTKQAKTIAKRIYAKDEQVAPFLATHAKRGSSLPAKVLMAAMQDLGPKFAKQAGLEGHHHFEGGKWYVDSNFINTVQHVYPGAKLVHMGMGEFYLKTPEGRLDFDRMHGVDFEGQVGRSHRLYDDAQGKVIDKAIKLMDQRNKSVKVARAGTFHWEMSRDFTDEERAAMQDLGPRFEKTSSNEKDADFPHYWLGKRHRDVEVPVTPEEVIPEEIAKTAAARTYGLYGFGSKTANLGITACAELREAAGVLASDLHHRRADAHEHITGFFSRHAKEGKCMYSKMLHEAYPDATMRLASQNEDWISWEE